MKDMYFKNTTPESAGISSKNVLEFIKTLDSYGFCTHSFIMARGDKIFAEGYYAPFDKDYMHRMYSVSKSFVSVAIGMAIDDGLISIDDKMIKYFPEYISDDTDELIKETTIRDMLRMETAVKNHSIYWFTSGTKDRNEVYFKTKGEKVPGTIYEYDSPGSYMLGVIVERVTGKPFLEYLREKALAEIGFSEEAYCLKVPGGYSFGDSGVICTARDLLTFARFVMNKGQWDGKQYMSRQYLEEAVKKQVCNSNSASVDTYNTYGYGYQIWKTPRDGFAFVGMGDQFAICDPETDFIFVINSDNQGSTASRPILYHELYKTIINCLSDPLPQDENTYKELNEYINGLKLFALKEDRDNPFINEINDKTYLLNENKMNIEYVKFHFEGKKGVLHYKNLQGEKELVFGIGYNELGSFPEEGYSDMVTTEFAEGNYYRCACSADWAEPQKLRIKVQIIDKYFGNGCFVFSFKDNRVSINMEKYAENFMNEYTGEAIGEYEKAERN